MRVALSLSRRRRRRRSDLDATTTSLCAAGKSRAKYYCHYRLYFDSSRRRARFKAAYLCACPVGRAAPSQRARKRLRPRLDLVAARPHTSGSAAVAEGTIRCGGGGGSIESASAPTRAAAIVSRKWLARQSADAQSQRAAATTMARRRRRLPATTLRVLARRDRLVCAAAAAAGVARQNRKAVRGNCQPESEVHARLMTLNLRLLSCARAQPKQPFVARGRKESHCVLSLLFTFAFAFACKCPFSPNQLVSFTRLDSRAHTPLPKRVGGGLRGK